MTENLIAISKLPKITLVRCFKYLYFFSAITNFEVDKSLWQPMLAIFKSVLTKVKSALRCADLFQFEFISSVSKFDS